MRSPHYIKKAGRASAPNEIIVVDTETWHGDLARVAGGELHKLRLGCALGYRLERGRRTRSERFTFTESHEFWDFVKERLNPRKTLWCFAHNAGYDLGVLGGWKIITSPEYEIATIAVGQQLLWIKGYWYGQALNFCDTGNYYHCSLESVGKAVGRPKMEMPPQSAPDRVWEEYCQNDVDVTADGLDMLIRFVRENELGPWAPSIAGLAFSAYRGRFMSRKILCHDYRDVISMERESYCGGVVDTHFVGRSPTSPVHEVDVCSMYPAMCLRPVPYKFVNHAYAPRMERVDYFRDRYMMTAKVTVKTYDYAYPVKTNKGTIYPHGEYVTTLAHPELMLAHDRGHIRKIHHLAWYESGTVLESYMRFFASKKIDYKAAGNDAFSTIAKYYANSLYGKFGQMSPGWERWGEDALRKLEEKHGLKPGALEYTYDRPPELESHEEEWHCIPHGVRARVRDYWGFVEVQTGKHESRDSVPAIAATITSYARVYLRECQEIAGDHDWFYSDTDSLWVSAAGLDRLTDAGKIAPGTLGALEHKGTHEYIIVHGPKDYETPTSVKLKGIKLSKTPRCDPGQEAVPVPLGGRTLYFIRTVDGKYVQTQFASAGVQIKTPSQVGVSVRYIEKKLSREITKCRVTKSGWTVPWDWQADRVTEKFGIPVDTH